MKRVFLFAALVAAPALGGEVPASVDPALIPHYSVIGPGLAAGGQPTAEGLKQLAAQGFKTVINLRTDAEPGHAEEQEVVKAQGLRYLHVPVSPATFRAEDVAAVKAVLDDPSAAPVLLHCATANRVGAVWAVIEAQRGKSQEEAEAEGRRVGLKSQVMVDAVRRVVEDSAAR
jgi:uncharacterized protein (TIGR01244 family)